MKWQRQVPNRRLSHPPSPALNDSYRNAGAFPSVSLNDRLKEITLEMLTFLDTGWHKCEYGESLLEDNGRLKSKRGHGTDAALNTKAIILLVKNHACRTPLYELQSRLGSRETSYAWPPKAAQDPIYSLGYGDKQLVIKTQEAFHFSLPHLRGSVIHKEGILE